MSESQNDFAALVASVQLVDVRLVEIHASTKIRSIRGLKNPQLVANHVTKVMDRLEAGFLVAGMMNAHVVSEGDVPGDDSPVSLKILLALEYSLPKAPQYSDDVLNEFAGLNATFNAWPYWREYIQTTVARMNLPPLMLPVLRFNRAEKPAAHVGAGLPDRRTAKKVGASARKKR